MDQRRWRRGDTLGPATTRDTAVTQRAGCRRAGPDIGMGYIGTVDPAPLTVRHCGCLVFPLPSWQDAAFPCCPQVLQNHPTVGMVRPPPPCYLCIGPRSFSLLAHLWSQPACYHFLDSRLYRGREVPRTICTAVRSRVCVAPRSIVM